MVDSIRGANPTYFLGRFGDGQGNTGNMFSLDDGNGNTAKGLQLKNANGDTFTGLDITGDPNKVGQLGNSALDKLTGNKNDQKGDKAGQGQNPFNDMVKNLAKAMFGKDSPLTKAINGFLGNDKALGGGKGNPAGNGGEQQLVNNDKSGNPFGGGDTLNVSDTFDKFFANNTAGDTSGGSDTTSGEGPTTQPESQAVEV